MSQIVTFEKPKQLGEYLGKYRDSIGAALPSHLQPDRMIRLALTEFSKQPKLRNCSGQSILSSIVIAAQLGLEPGITGQGYLVPYGSTCQFVPGWQGMVGLLNNTGRATAWTSAVYEGDKFSYSLGSHPHINHEPGDNFGDVDKITHFYACGKVNGAELPVIECWTKKRVEKHRDRYNKVGKSHYSFQHFEAYGRKVVLLQVLKYMPRSIQLNNALEVAEGQEVNKIAKMEGDIVVVEEVEVEENKPEFTSPKNNALPAATSNPSSADALREQLLNRMDDFEIGKDEMVRWCVANNFLRDGQTLTDLSHPKLEKMVEGWNDIKDAILQGRTPVF